MQSSRRFRVPLRWMLFVGGIAVVFLLLSPLSGAQGSGGPGNKSLVTKGWRSGPSQSVDSTAG